MSRFGPALGLPGADSGHNQLFDESRPPDGVDMALIVGCQDARFAADFVTCRRVGVD